MSILKVHFDTFVFKNKHSDVILLKINFSQTFEVENLIYTINVQPKQRYLTFLPYNPTQLINLTQQ